MKDKLVKIFLLIERFVTLGSVSLDFFAKVRTARKVEETTCSTCKSIIWKGEQPADWMSIVSKHVENCGKETKQESNEHLP